MRGARRRRPQDLPRRASATRRCTRRCSRRSASSRERRERILAELVARRLRRRSSASSATLGARPTSRSSCCCACPERAAARRCSKASTGLLEEAGDAGCATCTRCSRPRSPSGSSSTSGWSAASATTRARCSRSTTRRTACRSAAAGRYDELLGEFGRPLPGGRLRAQRRAAAHRAHGRGAADDTTSRSRSRAARCSSDTLDLLDRLGIDTQEVRDNDRKLLFEDAGIVTMRPSDVPTYVEAGAADIGITGKDVLMEQSEREVYELVDLGYGRCTMVLATVAGEDRRSRGAADAWAWCGSRPSTRGSRRATSSRPAARPRSSRSRARSSSRR